MTYDIQKQKAGRQPVYVLEMDIRVCTLTFGNAPCTAVEASPGTKCFNTFATCQDQVNYNDGLLTYRFSSERIDSLQQAGEPPTFPTLMKMDNAPAKLEPGKGLGIRSSAKITLMDHPWTDIGTDPYLLEGNRQYDPEKQGSFWGKFLARNPFYENETVRVKQGYLEDDGSYNEANMVTREYLLYRISGPDRSGKVVVECKDILKFADGVKAQVPKASVATLDGLLSNSATSFSFDDADGQIYTNFNLAAPFGPQEYVIIDEEVIKINTLVDNGGGNYTASSVTRASLPSFYKGTVDAEEHEDEGLIQQCWLFDNLRLDVILQYLLEYGANIPQSALDLSGWASVMDFGMTNYKFSTLLVEPMSVKDLITELSEYTIFFWWHERDKLVKMSSLLDLRLSTLTVFTDEVTFLANSISSTMDVSQRVSQVWIHYGHRSPLLDMDKQQYFTKLRVEANLDSETPVEFGTAAYKKIFSRWLTDSQDVVANEVGTRLLEQYDNTKAIIQASADPKDDDVWTGGLINATTQFRQNQFGADVFGTYLILQVTEKTAPTGTEFKYLLQEWNQNTGRYALIAPDSTPDYSLATEDQKRQYIFIAPDADGFSDGTTPYLIW